MWVLEGWFGGNGEDNEIKTSLRLLKPTKEYVMGRLGRNHPIEIDNKKISRDHCKFIVGAHTPDNVGELAQKPKLELACLAKKKITIDRPNEGSFFIVTDSSEELKDGDSVKLVQGISFTVRWERVCIYVPPVRPKPPIALSDCASLGIKVTYTVGADITHILLSQYVATAQVANSLLSLAQVVSPNWLSELLQKGSSAEGLSQLETSFELPSVHQHRPEFSPDLKDEYKVLSVWEPDEGRLKIFSQFRFVCLSEKTTNSDLCEVVRKGEGTWDNLLLSGGAAKFRKALERAMAKDNVQKIVALADTEAAKLAVGKEEWSEYVESAKQYGLAFLHPEVVVDAVLKTDTTELDTSRIHSAHAAESSPPSPKDISVPPIPAVEMPAIPPTAAVPVAEEPEEPAPPPVVRRLPRRVTSTSRAASIEPSAAPEPSQRVEESSGQPAPRRKLIRRANVQPPIVTGLDDPSGILEAPPDLSTPTVPPPAVPPTPVRAKLKRRVGTDLETAPHSFVVPDTIEEEPPLKKFRALFEATNDSSTQTQTETHRRGHTPAAEVDMTQSETQEDGATQSKNSLPVLKWSAQREEEEESGSTYTGARRPLKRTLASIDEGSGEVEQTQDGGERVLKRRALENVNVIQGQPSTSAVLGKPPSKGAASAKPPSAVGGTVYKAEPGGKRGATPGNPDKDTAFLKALASTKKGKKHEDEFDREFNKLKISKPQLNHRDPEEDWKVLDGFGDDSGLRGNFMTVVEMDVDVSARRKKAAAHHESWDGKPNFKKFKKKTTTTTREKIELFVEEEGDYGMGPAYWKNESSESQIRRHELPSQSQTSRRSVPPSQRSVKTVAMGQPILDSDDEGALAPLRRGRAKPPSRSTSTVPTKKPPSAKEKSLPPPSRGKSKPLFLDSDEDPSQPSQVELSKIEEDEVEELPSPVVVNAKPAAARGGSSRPAAAPIRKPPAAKGKRPVAILDEDSEDDAVFKGFGGRKR